MLGGNCEAWTIPAPLKGQPHPAGLYEKGLGTP